MRKLTRLTITPGLQRQLDWQARRIHALRSHDERYETARKNWTNAGKKKIRRSLITMNAGHDRCMYCEYSEAGTIDHFCPVAKDPKQSFHWRNYILACSPCQNAKNDRFPRELLNPARRNYQPWDHLRFEPSTGEYILDSTEAKVSGPVYRWDRGKLPRYRWKSFRVLQATIIAYAIAKQGGDVALAADQMEIARLESHPGVFDWIVHWFDAGPPAPPGVDPLNVRVRQAIQAHPEIRTWL